MSTMAPHHETDHHSFSEFLRFYKWTSIYSAVMLTLILVVFIISEALGG